MSSHDFSQMTNNHIFSENDNNNDKSYMNYNA